MLLLAGGLWAAAAAERWWPACRPGELTSTACGLVQDHRFDYVVPSAPWEPIGRTAEYAGAGYLALALAFAALAWGRPRRFALPLAATVALATATVGVTTLLSGLQDRPVAPSFGGLGLLVWALAGPFVVVALCTTPTRAGRRARGAVGGLLTGTALALATPIPGYLLAPTFLGSYDTPAWGGGVEVVALALAAAGAAWTAVRSAPGQGDREGGVAGAGGQLDVASV